MKQIKKIVVMTNEWFTNEKYRRNGIEQIIQAGYDVEIWNVNRIVFKEDIIPTEPKDLYIGETPVINFSSRNDLRKEIRKNRENTLVLNWYANYSETLTLCEEKIRYCNISGAPMLSPEYLECIDAYYRKKTWKNYLGELFIFLTNYKSRTIKMWPPLYNFVATPAEYFPICRFHSKKRMKFIHALDYDKILQDARKCEDEGFIVFVDMAWGIHPEGKALGYVADKDGKDYYYSLMRHLFDLLEKEYNKKVIIAAHPKAEYKGNEFGERNIIYFKTQELLRKCSFAILHISTATNTIVTYNKPFLPVTYEKINVFFGRQIELMEKYFGCKYFSLKDDDNPKKFLFHDREKYRQYMCDFVTMNDDTRLYVDIMLEEIEKKR